MSGGPAEVTVAGPASATAADRAPAEPPLEWSLNPWRRAPRAAVLAIVITLGVMALLVQIAPGPLWGVALGLAFTLALGDAYLPKRCRLDAQGVAVRSLGVWHRRAWGSIRRAGLRSLPRHGEHLVVTTQARPGMLDRFRELWLGLPSAAPEHDQVLGEIRARLALHGL